MKLVRELSDQELLERQGRGDAGAFNILFKRYYNSLLSYVLKNVADSFIAEELTMDVMLRLWEKKGEIYVEDDLRPYLFRAVKNSIYNHYRKKILDTVPLEHAREQHQQTSASADEAINSRDLEKIYLLKLHELSPQRRKVYQLSREENMTYAEIAKNMGLSINTVENYMVASLHFFRKHLKEHADFSLIFVITFLFS